MNFVQGELRSNVFEAALAEVAKHANFGSTSAIYDGSQIDPAVIVDVDCGDSPTLLCVIDGQRYSLELLPFHILPKRQARFAGVRKRDVHPTIFVEIENRDADGGRQ